MDPAPTTRPVCRLGLRIGPLVGADPAQSLLEWATGVALAAEQAGFDSLWLVEGDVARAGDAAPRRPSRRKMGSAYEAYSLLGALATRTHSLRLGVLPEGRDRRLPAVMAKIVTTVDVLSHGRGCLTLASAGPDEVEAEGVEPDGRELTERLQVCRTVLEDEEPEFAGRTYAVRGAFNRPRPVQLGGVPIVVATRPGRPLRPVVLRAAVDHADALIVDGEAAGVQAACRTAASDPPRPGRRPFEVLWTGTATDGASTPSGLAGQVRARLEAGAAGCIVDLVDADTGGALTRFGPVLREVVDSLPGAGDAG